MTTTRRPQFLHITRWREARCLEPQYFREQIEKIGDLTILQDGEKLSAEQISARVRECDVYLAGWDSVALPVELAANPGRLGYVCGITGTMREFVPLELVQAGIPLTNWGDAPAFSVAEGAMTLLLGTIKMMHQRIQWARQGNYWGIPATTGGTLAELNVGIYGCGVIGLRFIELLRPFGSIIRVFDPFLTTVPEGCTRVDTLHELFASSQAIVIHAGLTEQTRNSITAELLALLPDHGVIVNTARGGIIAQEALFAELQSGRLLAGLDVLEPDSLAADHPARTWENLILTCHAISKEPPFDPAHPRLTCGQQYCLENLRRFVTDEPLRFLMDPIRFSRST